MKTPISKVQEYIITNNWKKMQSLRQIWLKLRLHHQTVSNAIKTLKKQWIFHIEEWVIVVSKWLEGMRCVTWLYVKDIKDIHNKRYVEFVAIDEEWHKYKLLHSDFLASSWPILWELIK